MTFQILDDKTGVWESLLTLPSSASIDVERILADFQKQLPDNKFRAVEDGEQK